MTTDDRGSVLVIAVVLIGVAGAGVTSLTAMTHAVHRSRDSAQLRHELEVSTDSAVRLIAADEDSAFPCPSVARTLSLNGHLVSIDCAMQSSASSDTVRRGVITVANSASTSSMTPPTWAGTTAQAIAGDIVVNTGTSSAPSSALLDDTTPGWQTRSTSWTGHLTIPVVPPVLALDRPGSQVTRNGCTIYYPGRYLGSTVLTITGGQHYFASGVYYFERPITITSGALVVFGSGDRAGCTSDRQAILESNAPTQHGISGAGATLLFGSGGKLVVQESSMVINRRITTPDAFDADSNDVAIRTLTTGVNTTALTIPADVMRRSDGTTGPLSGFLTSTLSPSIHWAIDIRLNGSSITSNRFLVDGYIHTPVSGVRLTSTVTTYALQMTRGVTASRVTFALSSAPSESPNYHLGFTARPGPSRKVLQATATSRGRQATAERQVTR